MDVPWQHRPRAQCPPALHRRDPGGTLATWHAAATGELGGRSAPICCHKSGLHAAHWLPHCWGAPGALQHAPAAVAQRGPDPCLDPHTAETHSHGAGEAWRAAGPELGSAPHIGGASGEEQGNAGCPRCGDGTVPPSTGQPPAQPGSLFGSSGFVLLAHPGPIHHPGNKKVPLIYESPSRHPTPQREAKAHRPLWPVHPNARRDRQTDRPPAPTAPPRGRWGSSARPPRASPPHAASAAQSRRPDGHAHARWLGRQRLRRSPRTRVAPSHSTAPPASPGAAARRGR